MGLSEWLGSVIQQGVLTLASSVAFHIVVFHQIFRALFITKVPDTNSLDPYVFIYIFIYCEDVLSGDVFF